MRNPLPAAALGVLALLPALPEAPAAPAIPKSIVVVIGDGTGWQEWGLLVAARRAAGEKGTSAFHRLAAGGVVGCATTFSADSPVTDSAAGGTAIACGVKTNNGVVGMDAALAPAPTCLEAAAKRGLWTGIVTTTAVTDATPAAFTAHVKNRVLMPQVAKQQVRDHDLRVILGGGTIHFLPRTKTCAAAGEPGRGIGDAPSQRRDDVDLVAEAR